MKHPIAGLCTVRSLHIYFRLPNSANMQQWCPWSYMDGIGLPLCNLIFTYPEFQVLKNSAQPPQTTWTDHDSTASVLPLHTLRQRQYSTRIDSIVTKKLHESKIAKKVQIIIFSAFSPVVFASGPSQRICGLESRHHNEHIYLVYNSVCPLVRIGTPHSLSRKRVCPSPTEPKGGRVGHTRQGVRGGVPIRRTGEKPCTMSTLWSTRKDEKLTSMSKLYVGSWPWGQVECWGPPGWGERSRPNRDSGPSGWSCSCTPSAQGSRRILVCFLNRILPAIKINNFLPFWAT